MTDLNKYRNYARTDMNSRQYENAIFYAEILINANEECASDFLLMAEALYHNKEFRRAIHFIEKRKLEKKYLTFRLLAAQCCVSIKDYIKALDLLNCNSPNSNMTRMSLNITVSSFCDINNGYWYYDPQEAAYFGTSFKELESNCYLLMGEIYEYTENREFATDFYKLAVKANVRNVNAVRKLYKGNMLSTNEAISFLAGLDYHDCGDSDNLLRSTYENMFHLDTLTLNDSHQIEDHPVIEHPNLRRLSEATQLYNNSRFKKCYELTKSILKEDPHNTDCFILHSAVLKELKLENELYRFACSLIDMYPDKKESWYTMGCFYLAVGRALLARKQFMKATEIDKFFGYAWLAVGHTYSMENERDQALSAYSSASQAINESHIPILYIAVEYSLSKTMTVSFTYLDDAMKMGSFDPFCWHEKGFILYNNKNYQEALNCFLHAYSLREQEQHQQYSVISYWEPLLNNIGHCYFKLGDMDKALSFLDMALSKRPKNPSTLSTMALVHARKGDFFAAMQLLNKVLGLNRDNLFASSLLQVITNLNNKHQRKQIGESACVSPLSGLLVTSGAIENICKRPQTSGTVRSPSGDGRSKDHCTAVTASGIVPFRRSSGDFENYAGEDDHEEDEEEEEEMDFS